MIEWTSVALGDLGRLHSFLHEKNPEAAAQVVQNLTSAPEILLSNPRIGEKLFDFEPEEISHAKQDHNNSHLAYS